MAKILIVDDDPAFVHLLTNLIASFGETPITTMEGANFFSIIEKETIDLILLDIYMPIVSGLTLINQIKKHEVYRHIPVIMITGSDDMNIMTECFEAGASDFITKPISPVVLQARLSSILERQNSIKRLEKEIKERKKAESLLRKLSIAVEQSPGIVFLTDPQGSIEYANPKCLEITGYQLEDILGHSPHIFHSGSTDSATYDNIWKTISKGGTWKGELCNKKKDGALFWVLCSISPVLDEEGKISNFLAVQEDISDRILAEEALAEKTVALQISERRLRTILETTEYGIVVIGKNKEIHFVNPGAENLLCKPAKELLGNEFPYPFTLNQKTEIQIVRPDHPDIFADLRVVETETDDGPVWVASIRKVSEKKIIKQPIEKQIPQIENEVRALKQQPQSTSVSTKKIQNSTSEFISNISHEFRTPMHAILSFANFGIKKSNEVPREKLRHYFDQIKVSANRLMPLIDDLLDLSNLESRKIPYKMTKQDIIPTLQSVIREQKKIADDKKINIQLMPHECKSNSVFNKSAIFKVLRNVLQNAIHYSPEQSNITIKIENITDENNAPWLLLKISDEGIGIPEQELNEIFNKFIQSSKTKTCAGGTGIGLAICKYIISEHKGQIWAENNTGKGATISFTLPIGIN
ncbi:PAS/PAC sensor hybrid histidine kinase [Candidatus Magnetomorum sp. HK-1]|nr:PAS/PAC sensor hybrid histidine kinase [Candidatus Magnetomorum sp. HK-1]